MRTSLPSIVLFAILALAGCGGSGSSSGEKTTPEGTAPTVTVPKGPPPKRLVVKDIKEGTGATVKPGDEVTVEWIGIQYKSGKRVGSSWSEHHLLTFLTDAGRVIPGWDRGMIGMKVGGRRKLIIPPGLAYGATGTTSISPNETLIYVVDLLAVK
jgi:peptidylprolyl isomerase